MHLTRYTDYALRVLIFTGLTQPETATIREISEHYGISRNHLMKVVQDLNSKGYLIAQRGKKGGVKLNGPPERIKLGALVRDMEPDMKLVECFSADNQCVVAPSCELQRIFREALRAFLAVLDSYTLADILTPERRPELVRLLDLA